MTVFIRCALLFFVAWVSGCAYVGTSTPITEAQTDTDEEVAHTEDGAPAWQTDEIKKLIKQANYCDASTDCKRVNFGVCFSPCEDALVNISHDIYPIYTKIRSMDAGCPWRVSCSASLPVNYTEVIECQNRRCVWNWQAKDQSGADLKGAHLVLADLRKANLSEADLTGARLYGANLWYADLRNTNLTEADLSKANLSDADLTGAQLSGANLSGANLTKANLTKADLEGAHNLNTATLTGTIFCKTIMPDGSLNKSGC